MLKLWFDMSNDAFEEGGATECARILRQIADRIEYEGGVDYAPLFDSNGNKVGEVEMSRTASEG